MTRPGKTGKKATSRDPSRPKNKEKYNKNKERNKMRRGFATEAENPNVQSLGEKGSGNFVDTPKPKFNSKPKFNRDNNNKPNKFNSNKKLNNSKPNNKFDNNKPKFNSNNSNKFNKFNNNDNKGKRFWEDKKEKKGEGEEGDHANYEGQAKGNNFKRKPEYKQDQQSNFDFKKRRVEDDGRAEVVIEAKRLWEHIRQKKIDAKKRSSLVNDLMKVIDGKILDIIFKHDTSRVVQVILKYGTEEQRKIVFSALQGEMRALVKSHHANHLLKKIMKYGTPEQSASVLRELIEKGKFAKLLVHRDASKVLEYFYHNVATTEQKKMVVNQFYGPEFALFHSTGSSKYIEDIIKEQPDKKDYILKNIRLTIEPIINSKPELLRCTLVQHLVLTYLTHAHPSSITEILPNILPLIIEILHTKEGAKIGVLCVAHAGVKGRKTILKSMKNLIPQIAREEFGHVVLLSLLELTDDTSLTSKVIVGGLIENLHDLILTRTGALVVLQILAPRSSYFSPITKNLLSDTPLVSSSSDPKELVPATKKEAEIKRKENFVALENDLVKVCVEGMNDFLRSVDGANVLYEAIRNCREKRKILERIVTSVAYVPRFFDENNTNHILEDLVTGRFLKKLLKENVDPDFPQMMHDGLRGNYVFWCQNKNVQFVIASLLNSLDEFYRNHVKKEISSILPELQKSTLPGAKVLLKALEGEKENEKEEKEKKEPKSEKEKKSEKQKKDGDKKDYARKQTRKKEIKTNK